ncbi:hypothetical protein THO17_06680 [Marinomonas sp. THO17]
MKKLGLVLSVMVFATACSSMSIETYVSMYEKDCVPYLNSVIDQKVGDDSSAETRSKWEETMFKNYNIAKDMNNAEEVRKKAIRQASMTCDVQKKLGI